MPPKKTTDGKGKKAGLLAQHKKDVRQQVQQGKKELEVSDLTPDLINETTQITTLKVWAKKLGVPDLLSYKVANVKALKRVMLVKLAELKEKDEPLIDIREGDDILDGKIESDGELMKQYSAIEKFLKSYAKNPAKTTSIYGSAGDKFNELWKEMTRGEKSIFIQEYFELNVEPKKINPVAYLGAYLESKKGEMAETTESVTAAYLRAFIKNVGYPTEKNEAELVKLTEHVLFPKTFLTRFAALEQPVQLKFAGQYVRSGAYRNPLDALELFLNPPLKVPKERVPVQIMNVGGLVRKYAAEQSEVDATKKNNYHKCLVALRHLKWIIKPVSNVDEGYLSVPYTEEGVGAEAEPEWYYPSDDFFTDLCQYHSYVRSPKENIIVINSNKKVLVEVRRLKDPEYSPTQLSMDLQKSQTGSIFVKLTPLWVLNTPLYQVDDVYLDAPSRNLLIKTGIDFQTIVTALQKESRYETYQTYLLRFIVMFFPFMDNKVTNANIYFNKDALTRDTAQSHLFYIRDRFIKGYITQDSYRGLSISEKAPEADIAELTRDLENYLPVFSVETIKSTSGGYVYPTPIVFRPSIFRKIECPAEKDWFPQDLVVYKDRCLVIPQLLINFQTKNYTDPDTGEELDRDFVEGIKWRYSQLNSEKFQKRPVKVVKDSGEEEEVPGEVIYVDKALYDKAHPVVIRPVRKDKYTSDDLSNDFNKYFGLTSVILDPVALIENIMEFDIGGVCAKCGEDIRGSGVKSMINRTDGGTVQISFCDYKCMVAHDFVPLHTTEEEVEAPPTQTGDIVESV